MRNLEIFEQATKHGSYGFVFSYDELLAFVIEVRAEERLKCLKEFEDRVTEIGKILNE